MRKMIVWEGDETDWARLTGLVESRAEVAGKSWGALHEAFGKARSIGDGWKPATVQITPRGLGVGVTEPVPPGDYQIGTKLHEAIESFDPADNPRRAEEATVAFPSVRQVSGNFDEFAAKVVERAAAQNSASAEPEPPQFSEYRTQYGTVRHDRNADSVTISLVGPDGRTDGIEDVLADIFAELTDKLEEHQPQQYAKDLPKTDEWAGRRRASGPDPF